VSDEKLWDESPISRKIERPQTGIKLPVTTAR